MIAVDAQAVGDVVENRFREGIRPLKDHADAAAQLDHVHLQNVLAVEKDLALDAGVADRFVHAVEVRRKVDLPQPEGPISAVTLFVGNLQAHTEDRLLRAVEEIEIGDLKAHRRLLVRSRRRRSFHRLHLGREPCGDRVISLRGRSHVRHSGRLPGDSVPAGSPDLRSRTNPSNTSPAAQACRCQSSYGEIA